MKKIKTIRKKRPNFPRMGSVRGKIDGSKWRRPKGKAGRRKKLLGKNKGACPKIGYGIPKQIRNLHTSGKEIVQVSNLKDLSNVDPKTQIIKISNIGTKKKITIVEKAIEMKVPICNVRKPEEYLKNNKKEKKKTEANKEEVKK